MTFVIYCSLCIIICNLCKYSMWQSNRCFPAKYTFRPFNFIKVIPLFKHMLSIIDTNVVVRLGTDIISNSNQCYFGRYLNKIHNNTRMLYRPVYWSQRLMRFNENPREISNKNESLYRQLCSFVVVLSISTIFYLSCKLYILDNLNIRPSVILPNVTSITVLWLY